MLRRALLALAATCGLLAAFAAPASAAPDPTTCVTSNGTTTTVTICLDVTATKRGVTISGTGLLPPAEVVVHFAGVYQCNTSTCSWQSSQYGSALNTWTGAYAPYAFGHTYQACAEVTIRWRVAGQPVSELYDWICSGVRAN